MSTARSHTAEIHRRFENTFLKEMEPELETVPGEAGKGQSWKKTTSQEKAQDEKQHGNFKDRQTTEIKRDHVESLLQVELNFL